VAPGEPLEEISGTVPSLLERGAGCLFADRCGQVMPRCRAELPPVTTQAGGHQVACWLHTAPAAAPATATAEALA
jgi:oligopeptide/dipeptide ABC transporter ATP-binding protein